MVKLLKRLSLWIFLGLLAYMPLHIFLSTWIGTSLGILEFAKIAKDIVLIIGFGLALLLSIRQPWFKGLLKDKLIWPVAAYALLTLVLAAIKPVDSDAEILGIVYNLRFLLFFLYGILIANLFSKSRVQDNAIKIILGVGTSVLFLGIVQYTILPNDTLSHFGYSRLNGVLPAFFIDDKPDLERVMSTLRDPNSLGSYVIVIASLTLALFIKRKIPKQTALGLLTLSILCILFTFSRSAWVGLVASFVVVYWLNTQKFNKLSKYILPIGLGLVILLTSLYAARNTYLIQNVVLHSDESTTLEDPNQLRGRFWQESIDAIAQEPLGHGPGTAGLASIHNENQGTILNENYYLQIAHEIGIVGLLLFVTILVLVGSGLYRLVGLNPVATGLLASFIGLAITNFLVHIWSNEAVAYTWWGLAGLLLFNRNLRKTRRKTSS